LKIWGKPDKEKQTLLSKKQKNTWRVFQAFTTGFLWFTWLSHDIANIAVFLPREISVL
jgi:hypothetical protein